MLSTSCCENGPSYLPMLNSCLIACWKTVWCKEMLLSLGGMNVWATYLIPTLNPYCKQMGMCLYLSIRLCDSKRVLHPSTRYGVLVLGFGLCQSASLGSMVTVSAAGALVSGNM